MAKVFLDTNILVYTIDKKDRDKQDQSRSLIKRISSDHVPVISTQVLQEFYNAITSKLKVDQIVAKNVLHSYRNMEIVSAQNTWAGAQHAEICKLATSMLESNIRPTNAPE